MNNLTKETLVTRDGIKVEVGQVWRDCDRRGNRRCRVIELEPIMGKARLQNIHGGSPTWVSVRRMYKHATGWELVNE